MNWKKILRMDGFKVFIILIMLLFPGSGYKASISTDEEGHTEANINQNLLGLPFQHLKFEYKYDDSGVHVPQFFGNLLNFILDIIIAYLIAVLIFLGYNKLKK